MVNIPKQTNEKSMYLPEQGECRNSTPKRVIIAGIVGGSTVIIILRNVDCITDLAGRTSTSPAETVATLPATSLFEQFCSIKHPETKERGDYFCN